MFHANLDALERDRFAWPEPLVVDLVQDHYADRLGAADRHTVAKLQSKILKCLVDDDGRAAAALRITLIDVCKPHGIDPGAIAEADRAVIYELMRIAGNRFKNSPRLRNGLGLRLEAILAALTAEAVPPPLAMDGRGHSLGAIRAGWMKSSSAWRVGQARARVAAVIG